MKQYYEKIEIKSEKDLPKEYGNYFVNLKTDRKDQVGLNVMPFTEVEKPGWLDYIDWYLQPITIEERLSQLQPEKPRELTDEFIKGSIPYTNPISKHQSDQNLGWIKCMRFFRDQLSPKAKECSNCGKIHEYSADECYVKIGSKT